jgi:hypothetical protein
MRSLWEEQARRELIERLERLTPESKGRWGRMTCPEMLAHLVEAMRMALGELPTKSKGGPLRYSPINKLVIYWLPWPKGAPTAPELLARAPEEWERDVQAVAGLRVDTKNRSHAAARIR